MAINPQDRIHGACISEIVLGLSTAAPSVRVNVTAGADRSTYLFDCFEINTQRTCQFGLYVKYSRKRLSPWTYSYDQDHQQELKNIAKTTGDAFSVFINGEDGYACVDYQELRELLDDHFDEIEWVRVQRKLRESYRISGTDGARERPLAQAAFPQKIVDYVSGKLTGVVSESATELTPALVMEQNSSATQQPTPPSNIESPTPSGIKAVLRRLLG